jgi:pimeloyl-ACP methyl ester carboxylesterase
MSSKAPSSEASASKASTMTISEHEAAEAKRANQTGRTPVVFIHGLWLLPSSWDRWAAVFEEAGYTALTPGWPDDPETVEEAKADPEVFAHKTVGQVADHYAEVIGKLKKKPAVIGHSFGGLLAQMIAGRGLSAVSVAIDPAPFRGVLPLPISALKSSAPVLHNPANRNRAVPLSYEQFRRVRVARAGDVLDPAAADRDEDEHVQPPKPDGVDSEEVAGEDRLAVPAQERAPAQPIALRRGRHAGGRKHAAHQRRRHVDAELAQFADDPDIAPGRVLARQPHDQLAHLPLDRRPAWSSVRVRPAAGNEPPMPTQNRLRPHQERGPRTAR